MRTDKTSTHENVKQTEIKPPHFDEQKSIHFKCELENDFTVIISYICLCIHRVISAAAAAAAAVAAASFTVNESFHYFIAEFSSIFVTCYKV